MLLGAVLVLLLLGGAGPASAHAALRSTDPEDGSVLKRAPGRITLSFTESVGLLDDSFRVLDPGGHRLRTGEARHVGGRSDTAGISLPGKLDEGTYTVAWRVVSADSHPVTGAFTFSVGKASATTAAVDTGPDEDPLTGSLHTIARWLAYLAAALLIGTAAFVALCRPPDPSPLRTLLVTGWCTLLGATLALLVLRAPYEAGTGPATAFDASALGRTLTSRPGLALLARLALLLLAAGFLVRQSRRRDRTALANGVGGALAVGLALTWAAAEHASAGIQVPVAMTSSVLHLLATAVWLGGLAALLTTLYRSADDGLTAVVSRFSRIAFVSVTVLAVTGLYQSWRGLGSWSAFADSTYGRLLAAKLAAVTVLLLAAGYSRRWTARPAARGDEEADGRQRVPDPAAARAGAGTAGSGQIPEADVKKAVPARVPEPVAAGADAKTVVRERVPESVEGRSAVREREGDLEPVGGPPSPPEPSPAGGRGEPGGLSDSHRRGLRRSVLVEVVVSAVVLLLTTVLTSTLPARAEAEAAREAPAAGLPPTSLTEIPFDTGTPGGRGKLQITLDPGRTGDNGVQVLVYDAAGGVTAIPELRLSFTLPSKDIGPIDAELTDRGGYWASNTVTLPIAGTWTMKATIRVSELDQVTETRPVRILG
ncbi:copper resistance protein CopC [Streptomyces sp. S.PNR 29]|uniref:copper resistance CopC/CopD family protein n=1 Tax=Streptomyces sp. S.PNR 29 TaxID=2973805 RepID=UPI0025B26EDE|nr:copper resistance protein CopC [Streptomyces sp. S.PNR 29]MDN0199472.1 copper resistance protein CopC [Streptomyces sp. S.PNR 29]